MIIKASVIHRAFEQLGSRVRVTINGILLTMAYFMEKVVSPGIEISRLPLTKIIVKFLQLCLRYERSANQGS